MTTRCATCRHWEKANPAVSSSLSVQRRGVWGVCSFPHNGMFVNFPGTTNTKGTTELYTHERFGCVHAVYVAPDIVVARTVPT